MEIVKSYTKAVQWCIECGQYVLVRNHLPVHIITPSPPPPVPDYLPEEPSQEEWELINENLAY